MLAASKVKMSGREKNKVNSNTNFSCIKRVIRKLKDISCFSRAKQRQRNVQNCDERAKLFFAN